MGNSDIGVPAACAGEHVAVVEGHFSGSVIQCYHVSLESRGQHHAVAHVPAFPEGRSQGFVGHPRGVNAFVFKYRGRCHGVVVAVGEVATLVARDEDVRVEVNDRQFECGRAVEAVGEVDRCILLGVAHHAAARIGGGGVGHRAMEGAVVHVEGGVSTDTGHEGAAIHPTGLCGRHGHGAPAVVDGAAAFDEGGEGGGTAASRGDGAPHSHVREGRAVDDVEEGSAVAVTRQVGGDGVVVAVEGAAEGVVVGVAVSCARHGGDGDVGSEFHELAGVGGAVADVLREGFPVFTAVDEIRVGGGAAARDGCPRGGGAQGEDQDEGRP